MYNSKDCDGVTALSSAVERNCDRAIGAILE
jgi:hypothetical protein